MSIIEKLSTNDLLQLVLLGACFVYLALRIFVVSKLALSYVNWTFIVMAIFVTVSLSGFIGLWQIALVIMLVSVVLCFTTQLIIATIPICFIFAGIFMVLKLYALAEVAVILAMVSIGLYLLRLAAYEKVFDK